MLPQFLQAANFIHLYATLYPTFQSEAHAVQSQSRLIGEHAAMDLVCNDALSTLCKTQSLENSVRWWNLHSEDDICKQETFETNEDMCADQSEPGEMRPDLGWWDVIGGSVKLESNLLISFLRFTIADSWSSGKNTR